MIRASSRGNPNHDWHGRFCRAGENGAKSTDKDYTEQTQKRKIDEAYNNGLGLDLSDVEVTELLSDGEIQEARDETDKMDANDDEAYKRVGRDKDGNPIYVHGPYTIFCKHPLVAKTLVKGAAFCGIAMFAEYHVFVGPVLLAVYAHRQWGNFKRYVDGRSRDRRLPASFPYTKHDHRALDMCLAGYKHKTNSWRRTKFHTVCDESGEAVGHWIESDYGDRCCVVVEENGDRRVYCRDMGNKGVPIPDTDRVFKQTDEALDFARNMTRRANAYGNEDKQLKLKEDFLHLHGYGTKVNVTENETDAKNANVQQKRKDVIEKQFNTLSDDDKEEYIGWAQDRIYGNLL